MHRLGNVAVGNGEVLGRGAKYLKQAWTCRLTVLLGIRERDGPTLGERDERFWQMIDVSTWLTFRNKNKRNSGEKWEDSLPSCGRGIESRPRRRRRQEPSQT